MTDTRWSLIDDKIFSIEDPGGTAVDTLPGALARSARGESLNFSGLRAHQRQAWHQFLTQLAVAASDREGWEALPEDPAVWRAGLLNLTGGDAGAWALVVDDPTKPAFLQPPAPEGSIAGFKGPVETPDLLDVLNTASNHDIKAARIGAARPEHWVFALTTLQTQQGVFGRGNFGVARMNGGFASRPQFGFTPGIEFSAWFRRDVRVWLDALHKHDGLVALWLDPWDDSRPYSPEDLHPAFVEVCRRVRLTPRGDRIVAWTKTTKGPRVAAKELRGDVGDPWIPIDMDGAALTVSSRGLHYTKIREVLWGNGENEKLFDLPACLKVHSGDEGGKLELVARVMVRGQGKTEGLYQRIIPVPAKVARSRALDLGSPMGALSKTQVVEADEMIRLLSQAVCVFVQGGPEKPDFTDPAARVWRDRFDKAIDEKFFVNLWKAVPEDGGPPDPDIARPEWARFLKDTARGLLDEVFSGMPAPAARRYRAIAAADVVFEGGWRKRLPLLAEIEAEKNKEARS